MGQANRKKKSRRDGYEVSPDLMKRMKSGKTTATGGTIARTGKATIGKTKIGSLATDLGKTMIGNQKMIGDQKMTGILEIGEIGRAAMTIGTAGRAKTGKIGTNTRNGRKICHQKKER